MDNDKCPKCGSTNPSRNINVWTKACAGEYEVGCLERQLAAANAKIAEWEDAAVKWFASPEAKKQLDGYRELADKVNAAELALAAANERVEKLEKALSACDDDGWRGMESAPKDGTLVLLFNVNEYSGKNHYVGSWRAYQMGDPQATSHDIAWRAYCCGRFSTPTHWMPLPEGARKDGE